MVLLAADDSVVCGGARLAVDQSSGRFDVHAQVEQLDTGQMMRRHDGMVEAQAGAAVVTHSRPRTGRDGRGWRSHSSSCRFLQRGEAVTGPQRDVDEPD